ncbi:MAG: carboxylating nicotinate-nucleotide diphosphorylase [Candidatus Adiutricales bacterium]
MKNDHIENIVRLALAEDVGIGDITTFLVVDSEITAQAEIMARQDMVVAGMEAAHRTFEQVDASIKFDRMVNDGDVIDSGVIMARVSGPAGSILTAERVALNFLMRLSGVATLTARFVGMVSAHNVKIVDTRKTTPGMRALEKAAVRAGGGGNHRFGLFDGVLIKDNHIAAAGSITQAVTRAKAGAPHTIKVEVEVEDLQELEEAIEAGADAVLLDNMAPAEMRKAVTIAKGRVLLEASGGVTLDTVEQAAASGVDIISIGALTHSAPATDISLNFILGDVGQG